MNANKQTNPRSSFRSFVRLLVRSYTTTTSSSELENERTNERMNEWMRAKHEASNIFNIIIKLVNRQGTRPGRQARRVESSRVEARRRRTWKMPSFFFRSFVRLFVRTILILHCLPCLALPYSGLLCLALAVSHPFIHPFISIARRRSLYYNNNNNRTSIYIHIRLYVLYVCMCEW